MFSAHIIFNARVIIVLLTFANLTMNLFLALTIKIVLLKMVSEEFAFTINVAQIVPVLKIRLLLVADAKTMNVSVMKIAMILLNFRWIEYLMQDTAEVGDAQTTNFVRIMNSPNP